MVVHFDEHQFLSLGLDGRYSEYKVAAASGETNVSRFEGMFALSPSVCSKVFYDIQVLDIGAATIRKPKPVLFLMYLNWVKRYQVEEILAASFGIHENTVRKWLWSYAFAVQTLKLHKVRSRYLTSFGTHKDILSNLFCIPIQIKFVEATLNDNQQRFLCSVDGTHCRIQEPRSYPNKDWYSHKFEHPGCAYEIGVDLFANRIVWMNGPFMAGETGLVIFRKENGLKSKVADNQKIIGDKGYCGDAKVSTSNEFQGCMFMALVKKLMNSLPIVGSLRRILPSSSSSIATTYVTVGCGISSRTV